LHGGWRIKVELGIAFALVETELFRMGDGEETGCGMNDGLVPPRLFGGVTNALGT
jgi:hypothetical protein